MGARTRREERRERERRIRDEGGVRLCGWDSGGWRDWGRDVGFGERQDVRRVRIRSFAPMSGSPSQ
jgi:hypothetical protein